MRSLKYVVAAISVLLLCTTAGAEDVKIPAKVVATVRIPTWYHEGLYFDGKSIWVTNGLKGKVWVVDPASGKVKRELAAAGTFTESVISKEKGSYIVTDWDMEKIYTAHIENNALKIDKELPLDKSHPAGAVWNGKHLFVITWTRSLSGTKFGIMKMDDKFELINSYQLNDIQEPSQAAWDGKNLWISSWYDRRIYKIDPDTMAILGYIDSPVKKTTGIAWQGKNLWVTGTYSDLYKMELEGKTK